MYRDLLTQALDTHEEWPLPGDLLLAELVDLRARLDATDAATPVTEALARELSYDSALIRLCASLEVRATPAWFDSPEHERARLEHELARRGIRLPQLQHASFFRHLSRASVPGSSAAQAARPIPSVHR